MDHLLSLSKAAKLAGVSRRAIQEKIQDGALETFEGQVRLTALLKVYPGVDPGASAIVERVGRIRDSAMNKRNPDTLGRERSLPAQVRRLQRELANTQAELADHKALTLELHERLTAMQAGLDRRERQMLQALLKWMSMRLERQRL